MSTFRIIAANIESLVASPALAELINRYHPDVVVVEQAYHAHDWLNSIPGYRLYQYQGHESKGIAVLIRNDIKMDHRRALRMRLRWHGPPVKGGGLHQPRTYPAFRLRDGIVIRLLALHLPTHNNPAAQAESMAAAEEYLNRHPAMTSVAVGDWNRVRRELAALVDATGAEIMSAGKVDHAVVTNADRIVSKRLPTPEGAHGWGLYTITVKEEEE